MFHQLFDGFYFNWCRVSAPFQPFQGEKFADNLNRKIMGHLSTLESIKSNPVFHISRNHNIIKSEFMRNGKKRSASVESVTVSPGCILISREDSSRFLLSRLRSTSPTWGVSPGRVSRGIEGKRWPRVEGSKYWLDHREERPAETKKHIRPSGPTAVFFLSSLLIYFSLSQGRKVQTSGLAGCVTHGEVKRGKKT